MADNGKQIAMRVSIVSVAKYKNIYSFVKISLF